MNDLTVTQNTEIAAIVPVSEGEIGGMLVRTINARDLHAWLDVKSEFRNWIKNRIDQFGFAQDVDFVAGNFLPGSDQIDYHLALDMAKELSMVERTPKGKEARLYFIACERRAQSLQFPNFDDPVAAARAWADEREHRLKLEGQTRALEQRLETDRPYTEIARAITGQHTMTRRDWCALLKDEHGAAIGEKKLNQWLRDKGYIYMDRLDNTARAYAGYSSLFKLEIEVFNGYPRKVLKLTGQGVLELTPKVLADFGYTQQDAA